MTLTIGFVGCGLIARSHAAGLSKVPDVRIGPVFDIDPERAARFAAETGGDAVESLSAVVEQAEAVYVCTWTSEHPAVVRAVADAGKPVFCEKPLAIDLATASAMTDGVEHAGVINQVGLVLRRSPSFRWLRAQLADPTSADTHGRLMSIIFRDDQYIPVQGMYGSTWRADVEKAGAGALLEHSIHDLDLLEWMMGPIVSVSARVENRHDYVGIDDQSAVTLVAESGAHATLVSLWHDMLGRPSQRRVEVFCERTLFTLEGDWYGPVRWERHGSDDEPSTGAVRDAGLVDAARGIDGATSNPDRAFIDAIRGGRPAQPDFRTALRAHELADAAYRSAANGGGPIDVS